MSVEQDHPVGSRRDFSVPGKSPLSGTGTVTGYHKTDKGPFVVVKDSGGTERRVRPARCTVPATEADPVAAAAAG